VIALVLVLLVAAATRLLSTSDATWVHARN
jgi:hypothetical protein